MKKDFSNVPVIVTINNTTGNKIDIQLRNLVDQVVCILESEEQLVLKVTSSDALALLSHKVEDCGLKMTVESGEEPTEVTTTEDLKEAIQNGVTEVKLTDNITVDSGNLVLGQVKHFDGNGKTITFASTGQNLVSTNSGTTIENVVVENTVATDKWSSTYGVQCYNGEYTVRNVKVSGCNGGILINSATVNLEGTIDVSGNKFGGIEVSKSSNPDLPNAVLNINGATLINTTEEYAKPTIWTDGEGNTVNGAESMFANSEIKEGQVQYYLEEAHSTNA